MDDSGRDDVGRFAPGHRKLGGRRAGQTISAELRRQVDPESIARFLLSVINDLKAPLQQRLAAAGMVQDRLEGRAVTRSELAVTAGLGPRPPGWSALTPEHRAAWLDQIRSRVLAGTLTSGVTSDEDPQATSDDVE